LRCPKQYKYQNIDKVKGAWSMWAIQGSVTHKLLEKLASNPSAENIEKYGNEMIASGDYPVELVLRAIQDVSSWFDLFKFKNKIIGVEAWFSIVVDDSYRLNGVMDRVDLHDDGTIEVIDYKTGFFQYTEKQLFESVQLDIYAVAAASLYNAEKIMITYENINGKPGSTTYSVIKNKFEIEQSKARITSYIENFKNTIAKETFNANVGPHCRFCAFNKICDDFRGYLDWNEMTPDMDITDLLKLYDKSKAQERYAKQVSWAVRERIGEFLGVGPVTEFELDGLKANYKAGKLMIKGSIKGDN
jgi:CRISPR/Cas system-associated exonuclease Cas4 (RecB family)